MTQQTDLAGSFTLPGTSMTVDRMGYGAMQLAGRDGNKLVWGPPRDIDAAIAVLREAIASGVNHIDTADFYGPHVTNQIIRKALLAVSRRSGDRHESQRPPRRGWIMDSGFLTRGVDCGDSRQPAQSRDWMCSMWSICAAMFSVHGPAEGSIEAPLTVLAELQQKGLVRHIGLSNVTPSQIAEAQRIAPIVCVQNQYNLAHRTDDALIADLARDGIAYVPFFPLGGFNPLQSTTLSDVAARLDSHADAGCTGLASPPIAQYPGDPRNILHRASSRKSSGCETPHSC